MYRPILEVSWLHDFYAGGQFKDVQLLVDPYLQRQLKNYKLHLRQHDTTWTFSQRMQDGAPLISLEDSLKLVVGWTVSDDYYQAKWSFGDFRPSRQVVYLRGDSAAVYDRMYIMPPSSSTPPCLEFDGDNRFVRFGTKSECVGLVELQLSNTYQQQSIRFPAASFRWEYVLISKYVKDLSNVEFTCINKSGGQAIAFDYAQIEDRQLGTIHVFTSSVSIPAHEDMHYQVDVALGGTVLRSGLPQPNLRKFAVSKANSENRCLQEFINI